MNDRPRIEKLRRDHPVDLFDFMAAPTDPYHLFVLLKDVRAILQ